MTKIIKSNGIEVGVKNGRWLLSIKFRDLQEQAGREFWEDDFSWMPSWQAVRDLMLSAVLVEIINVRTVNEEINEFAKALADTRKALDLIVDMLNGQMGIEG